MKDLNTITSCPCSQCRSSLTNKNISVLIVKRRNGGREGQFIRHAKAVKKKFMNQCFLSNSTFDLHYHHLDGQDYYVETAKNWDAVSICLNATIHRDYHNNFLPNVSKIKKEYEKTTLPFSPQTPNFVLALKGEEARQDFEGAEVSRYTFLEYLRFLLYEKKSKKSDYIAALEKKMQNDFSRNQNLRKPGNIFSFTEEKLSFAFEQYKKSFQGENWSLASDSTIPFANNQELWKKVENTWKKSS